MKLEITHFIPGPPEPQRYVPLVCYCKVVDKNYYIEGMNESAVFEPEEIDTLERSGDIIKLSRPYEKTKENCLWVIPSGHVVLASKHNPVEDENRMVVAKILLKQPSSPGTPNTLQELVELVDWLPPPEKVDVICDFLMRADINEQTITTVKTILHQLVSELLVQSSVILERLKIIVKLLKVQALQEPIEEDEVRHYERSN